MAEVKLKDKTHNQVNVIHPYRYDHGVWAFDDEEVGLQGEPFVGNINKMIDMYAMGVSPVVVYISKDPLPNHSGRLKRIPPGRQMVDQFPEIVPEGWYELDGYDTQGWLCPAVLKYFDGYPDNIYFRIEN